MKANHPFTKKCFELLLIVFVGTFFSTVAIAQRISIVSKNTGEPLPYATITNINAKWANVSKADGSFVFTKENSNPKDTLIISYTGYETITLTLPESDKRIVMQPVAEMLMPVEVVPCKTPKKTTTSNFIQQKTDHVLGSLEKALGTWAAHIPNNVAGHSKVSSIQFFVSHSNDNKTSQKAPLKIRILEYDTTTKLPGSPLVFQEFLVYPTKSKVTLNLNDNAFRFPKEGIVIVIDFFFAGEEYVYYSPTKLQLANGVIKDTVLGHYGAKIKAAYGSNLSGQGFRYNYIKQTWALMRTWHFESTFSAPMIKLELIACD